MPISSLPQPGKRGQVFYVGDTDAALGISASDQGYGSLTDPANTYGLDPFFPFATLAYCMNNAVVAGRGDVVYVVPGTAITVATAGGLSISKANTTVIGMGAGTDRPTVTFTTATTATCTMTAANCSIENFTFTNAVDSQASMIVVSAADCTIKNCIVNQVDSFASPTTYALIGILTTASANRLKVLDCVVTGDAAGAAAGTVRHTNNITIVGGDGIKINGNQLLGRVSATLGNLQIITTLSSNLTITNNYMSNSTTSAAKAIVDTVTGTTGFIDGNRYQILSGTAPVTASTMAWGLNYYKGAIGTAMTVI